MRLDFWLKAVVSLGLLVAVAALSHPDRILSALARADLKLVLAGTAIWVAIQLLNVFKWQLLNRAQGLATSFGQLLDVYYVGMFFNTFLPSGFGGDAVRAYELSRLSGQAGSSLASVAVDRFTSLYALLLLGTGALVVAPAAWRVVPLEAVLALDLAGAAAFGVLLQAGWLKRLAGWRAIARLPRVAALVSEVATAMTALRAAGTTMAVSLAVSLLYQFLAVVLHYVFMLALGLPVAFGYAAVFIPILSLAASLPVSINGLGVREGGYAFFLGKLGIAPGEAVSVGLLSLAMLLLSAAWGALRYARLQRTEVLEKEVRYDVAG
jgi:hypothetical protein